MFSFISPTFWSGIYQDLKPTPKFPFDPNDPSIIIPVTLIHHEASTQVNMALDTGASFTVLDDDLATALGLINHTGKTIDVATANGPSKAYQTKIDELAVLGKSQENSPLIITDLTDTGLDGLLGLSFLKHYKLTINFKENYLQIN